MRAFIGLRAAVHYRREIFEAGLKRVGYKPTFTMFRDPGPGDLAVIWNRYGAMHQIAKTFEAAGARVLVTENGYLGKESLGGDHWLALALGQHNGAGDWRVGGPERWDSLGVDLKPWRSGGDEAIVLPQRGIGPPGVAMPRAWTAKGRVRPHPGNGGERIPLERDLARARCFVTWGSGAALKALILGVPGFYAMPNWIGAPACKPIGAYERGEAPLRDDEARLTMFRRLAWAMWRRSEIQSGEAFAWLL